MRLALCETIARFAPATNAKTSRKHRAVIRQLFFVTRLLHGHVTNRIAPCGVLQACDASPDHYRRRAEQADRLADDVVDSELRAQIRRLAITYRALADDEERLPTETPAAFMDEPLAEPGDD